MVAGQGEAMVAGQGEAMVAGGRLVGLSFLGIFFSAEGLGAAR